MAVRITYPPGRAGRLSLQRRLATATRGREQLDRELAFLTAELGRLQARADGCRRDWLEACADGRTWVLRAAVLGGDDALRHATPLRPARVRIAWADAMVDYPADAALSEPAGGPDPVADNSAVGPAREAAGRALLAAARSAAADEAVRRMELEVAATRRRLRALDKVWIPRLTEALATVQQLLDQAEQEELVRVRAAVQADRSTT